MSVIVINQSVIHYESLGRGRPVLFLHTWVGSWRYWVPSLQAAAAAHSAYTLDLYGFGDTARDSSQVSIVSQAALVGSFMDEMGIDRVAMVGHGLGALVGLRFAGMYPSRVARFMAVSLPLDPGAAMEVPLARAPDQLLSILDPRGTHSAELLPETGAIDPAVLLQMADAEQIRWCHAALRAAGIPTLVINGANDPLLQSAQTEQSPDLGSHVSAIVFPESAHFPMLDAPDAFHRLMVDFLALEAGASPRQLRLKEEWRRRVR